MPVRSSQFILIPYVGTGTIDFGTSLAETRVILGDAERSSKNRRAETLLTYESCRLTFSSTDEKLVEIAFWQNVVLLAGGIDIFNDAEALAKLASIDRPLECVGILFFERLGLSITGLHNGGDKVVTAISAGRFDTIKEKFSLFNLNSQENYG